MWLHLVLVEEQPIIAIRTQSSHESFQNVIAVLESTASNLIYQWVEMNMVNLDLDLDFDLDFDFCFDGALVMG